MSQAIDFIKQWFGATESPVYFCSLANDRDDSKEPTERHVATREGNDVEAFIAKWDRAGRGLYICVSTIRASMQRNKDNVAEVPGLWVDVDFKDVAEDAAYVLRRISALRLPPSITVSSGNGYHFYWLFKEPIAINIIDGVETTDRIESALKQLADLCGGDMKLTQIAALMRLPATHNSKRGEWKDVEIIASNASTYELDDLEEMLSETSCVVLRKLRPAPTTGEINPYLEIQKAAKEAGWKLPIDAEQRLSQMLYMGGEESSIHGTQVAVTASLLSAGRDIEEVVSLVLEATRAAAGDYGARWNWKREEKAIRGMCATWIKKHPKETTTKAKPQPQLATVHKLDDARAAAKKEEPKPKSQKIIDRENIHTVIGATVLKLLQDKGTPIMVVVDQLWRYDNTEQLWSEIDGKGRYHLDALIETTIRGLNMVSNLKLVAESRGWLLRNPDIHRDGVVWDDHGKIAVKGGLIDIKTQEFIAAQPAHHVTARVNAVYDAAATCPVWLEMLESTFADRLPAERKAVIGLLQELLGMALIEDKSKALSRALIFHGASNTGKTDLIKTMSGLLTDNPIATPIGALDGTHGLMEFHRKAPWVLHEAFNGAKWHFSDIVKTILSGDPVQINIKNGAVVTQRIRQPIFWGTNYPPQFKEATRAIINRMVVIPTATVFDPKNPTGVAVTARLAGFSEPSDLILATERPGLLNWALAGLRRALERGLFETTADIDATLEAIRTDSNVIVSFLDECVTYGPSNMISTSDFCAAFAVHYEENKGGDRTVPSNDSIGRALVALADPRIGIDRKVLRDNKHGYYIGLHLNDIGLDYWASAATEGLAKGKTARLANTPGQVNRIIPAIWNHLAVVQRVENHFKNGGATSEKSGSVPENHVAPTGDTSPRF